MTTVEIDLNVRVRGDQTFSGFEDVKGEVALGRVIVVESESGWTSTGEIVDIDHEKRLVYLTVDWERDQLSSDPDDMMIRYELAIEVLRSEVADVVALMSGAAGELRDALQWRRDQLMSQRRDLDFRDEEAVEAILARAAPIRLD